jgi:hypothetical protein
MKKPTRGFSYTVEWEQIQKYRSWPPARRLQWLFEGNKLRRNLPAKVIEIQEAFRQGKI